MLICDRCLPEDIRRGPLVGVGRCRLCKNVNMMFNITPTSIQLIRIRDGKTVTELASYLGIYFRDIEHLEQEEKTPKDVISWLKLVAYYGDLLEDTEPTIPAMRGPFNPGKVIYDRFCEEAFKHDLKTAAQSALNAFPEEVNKHSSTQALKNKHLQEVK